MPTIQLQQARLGILLDLDGHEPVAIAFPMDRMDDIVRTFETHVGITPERRRDPSVHHDERRKLLGLMVAGLKGAIPTGDWRTTCALGLVWTALTHPHSGDRTRTRIETLAREVGRATLVLAPGAGDTLDIEVSDVPIESMAPPASGLRP